MPTEKPHQSNAGRRGPTAPVETPRLAAFTPSMQTVQEDALSPRSDGSPRQQTPVTATKPPIPDPSARSNSIVKATTARKSRGVSMESTNDSVASLPAPPPPPYTRYGIVAHPGNLTIRHFPVCVLFPVLPSRAWVVNGFVSCFAVCSAVMTVACTCYSCWSTATSRRPIYPR
jgi:hypothetical protein